MEIGSHENEDEAYSDFYGFMIISDEKCKTWPTIFFGPRGNDDDDHDGGDEEEKWLLTILLAVMMVGIGMLVEVVEMMMTMLMMLMMMMMIYIYDEMFVCHEKSSLPSFELSAGRAKWAAC